MDATIFFPDWQNKPDRNVKSTMNVEQHAARSTQHAARSTQHAARSTQHAARSTQHAAHSTQHAAQVIQIGNQRINRVVNFSAENNP